MSADPGEPGWVVRLIRARWPFERGALRPADVSAGLLEAMLSGEASVEDARYQKVVPNHFIVELAEESYRQGYQPIADQITTQWREQLLRRLVAANGRLGRAEYRFGGAVRVELRPVSDLPAAQARVRMRIEAAPAQAQGSREYGVLEMLSPESRLYPLAEGSLVIGRGVGCDLRLDSAEIREARLISGQHAVLHCRAGNCLLCDGSSTGRPSTNGTYVNREAVSTEGRVLADGDLIILAASDPTDPRPDTPGTAAFRYHSRLTPEE